MNSPQIVLCLSETGRAIRDFQAAKLVGSSRASTDQATCGPTRQSGTVASAELSEPRFPSQLAVPPATCSLLPLFHQTLSLVRLSVSLTQTYILPFTPSQRYHPAIQTFSEKLAVLNSVSCFTLSFIWRFSRANQTACSSSLG